jgi:hypothetical protein
VKVVHAHTVALMRTVLPGARSVPSVVSTLIRSFDSSKWKLPEVPSAQESLMVLGWLGSGPRPARPRSRDAPESQAAPTVPHFGACSAASHTAVLPICTVTVTESLALPQVVVAVTL